MQEVAYEELADRHQRLVDAAFDAMDRAYSPYSHFCVGAALLTVDGTIISGSNVENAALGLTVCAEHAAVVRANSMGHREFEAIAVIGRGESGDRDVTAPCGACRQVLYEASARSGSELEILLSATDKRRIVRTTIAELLPMPFDLPGDP